jgi:toxin ParE1/3/4
VTYRVTFTPEAVQQLIDLDDYLAGISVPGDEFIAAIVNHCETLATFPMRGRDRSDIKPGLRVTGYKRRVVIAYSVTTDTVTIAGVFYAGQDFEPRLAD